MPFEAPSNYKEIHKIIYNKCLAFIELKYWSKLSKRELDDWLKNFKNDKEKYLAILILNKLKYRNELSIISMLHNIFYIEVPIYLKEKKVFNVTDLDSFRLKLFEKEQTFSNSANFRFSTITSGDLGESGHIYIKYMREYFVCSDLIVDLSQEKNQTSEDKYYVFENIESRIKTIIFVDDFIGSGEQVEEFINNNKKKLKKFKNIVFMPLIAHQEGINRIEKLMNNIEVRPIELITFENSFFYLAKDDKYYFDGKNTAHDLHEFYKNFISSNKLEIKEAYGFGKLGLTHIFSTGVPDNNLSIIHKKNNKWTPLKEKR